MFLVFKQSVCRVALISTLFISSMSTIVFPTLVFAQVYSMDTPSSGYDTKNCASSAGTEWEYKKCIAKRFEQADQKLNKVYNKIREVYKEEKSFLRELKEAQLAWIKLRDANIAMQYPPSNNSNEYGSVVGSCYLSLMEQYTIERINFLEQWLIGSHKDVCSGSIMDEYYLKEILQDEYGK